MVVGNHMTFTLKQFAACAGVVAAILGSAGCTAKRIPPMTVEDLMEDRVTLDGVLLKCNEHPAKVHNDSDCRNALIAVERLAKDVDPAEEARRNSPALHLPECAGPLVVAVGADELPELRRQSREHAARWRLHGLAGAYREIPDCHHYAALEQLAHPDGALARELVELVR